ncbi:sigma factor [Pedobacter steynii]|uniref:RNA polymerase sigma-70 region 2 domain-containing protein n=1 Tax=Pedobacter steynii TaxID=430522 RepID=A0A1D7QHZ1_9SPHI|nr:sigma factor [Pedobacter steynii]AOM78229.1 hypothetical protein BFS30_14245 [Pedobacter steynii]
MVGLKNFEHVYIHRWEKLYAFCFRMTGDEHIAQNIVQDIFTDLWERRDEVDMLSIESYLFGAAKNQVLKEYGKKKLDAGDMEEELLIERSKKQKLSEAEHHLLDNFFTEEYNHAEWSTEITESKAHISANIYQKVKKKSQLIRPFRNHYRYAIAATILLIAAVGILSKPKAKEKEIVVRTTSVTDSVKSNGGLLHLETIK